MQGRVPAEREHQGKGDRLPDKGVRQGDQRVAQAETHPSEFETVFLLLTGTHCQFLTGLEKAQEGASDEKRG